MVGYFRWMVSRRSRDLALLSLEGSLNVVELTQMLQLREKARVTIVMQTLCTSNPSTMRQMDRFVCVYSGSVNNNPPPFYLPSTAYSA
jgi:hypothetical protein